MPEVPFEMDYNKWKAEVETAFGKIRPFLFLDEYRQYRQQFTELLDSIKEAVLAHGKEEAEEGETD